MFLLLSSLPLIGPCFYPDEINNNNNNNNNKLHFRIASIEEFIYSQKSYIKNEKELLFHVLHFVLKKQFDFISIGNGEHFGYLDTKSIYYHLPNGWNKFNNIFHVKYCFKFGTLKILLKGFSQNNIFTVSIYVSN